MASFELLGPGFETPEIVFEHLFHFWTFKTNSESPESVFGYLESDCELVRIVFEPLEPFLSLFRASKSFWLFHVSRAGGWQFLNPKFFLVSSYLFPDEPMVDAELESILDTAKDEDYFIELSMDNVISEALNHRRNQKLPETKPHKRKYKKKKGLKASKEDYEEEEDVKDPNFMPYIYKSRKNVKKRQKSLGMKGEQE